jgi:hypothetical protein
MSHFILVKINKLFKKVLKSSKRFCKTLYLCNFNQYIMEHNEHIFTAKYKEK